MVSDSKTTTESSAGVDVTTTTTTTTSNNMSDFTDESRMSTGENVGKLMKQRSNKKKEDDDSSAAEAVAMIQEEEGQYTNGNDGGGEDDKEDSNSADGSKKDVWDSAEEDELELEEDVYSMMFLESWNIPFYYAFGTALMQVFIISLFLFDLIKGNSRQNYLNLPVAVEPRIRIAQFLALPLCIMTHTDCTTAVYYLRAKYHPSILEKVPTATKRSWRFSLLFRFVVGSMLIFASFIQVMQSTTITDLFLNLESIVFVGEVDNFAFWLAEKGFLTQQLQHAAKLTKSITMHAPHTYIPKRASTRRKILFGVYVLLMLSWIFIVLSAQFGRYVLGGSCKTFTVSFGDDELILDGTKINVGYSFRSYLHNPDEKLFGSLNRTRTLLYSHFSGTYRILENAYYPIPIHQRAVYYESLGVELDDFPDNDPSLGKFVFCEGDKDYPGAWIFTIEALDNAFERRTGDGDDCGKWLLRSPPTNAAKLEDVPLEGWKVWTEDGVSEPSYLNLVCDECKRPVDCSYFGTCDSDSRVCDCDPTRLGNRCETPAPCDSIRIIYLGETSFHLSSVGSYQLLLDDGTLGKFESKKRTKLLYGRPVYVHLDGANSLNESLANNGTVEFVHYAGSRWVLSTWDTDFFLYGFFPNWPETWDRQIPHGFWDSLTLSSPQVISEVTESASPIGLNWFEVLDSKSRGDYGHYGAIQSVKLGVYCETCDDNIPNICGQFGSCIDGSCECSECFGGNFCEYSRNDDYVIDMVWELEQGGYDNVTETYGLDELQYADLFLSPGQCYNETR